MDAEKIKQFAELLENVTCKMTAERKDGETRMFAVLSDASKAELISFFSNALDKYNPHQQPVEESPKKKRK